MITTYLSPTETKETAASSLLSRIGNVVSSLRQRIEQRWQGACEAFWNVLEAEARIDELSQALANEPLSVQKTVILAGFLISKTAMRSVALYEGSNYFAFEKDVFTRVSKAIENAIHPDADFDLRIKEDLLELESFSEGEKSCVYGSNDSVAVGQESYILKLLPKESRTEVRVSDFTGRKS